MVDEDGDVEESCVTLLIHQCHHESVTATSVISSFLQPLNFSRLHVSLPIIITFGFCLGR